MPSRQRYVLCLWPQKDSRAEKLALFSKNIVQLGGKLKLLDTDKASWRTDLCNQAVRIRNSLVAREAIAPKGGDCDQFSCCADDSVDDGFQHTGVIPRNIMIALV